MPPDFVRTIDSRRRRNGKIKAEVVPMRAGVVGERPAPPVIIVETGKAGIK